jgi:hypothetical protein
MFERGYAMSYNNIIFSLFSIFLLSGCGGNRDETLNVKLPDTISALDQKLNSKAFYATKNADGSYSTFVSSWVVPPYVKSVKIVGCSGGNGGGGGGAGGAGAKFFTGSWGGASWGGNGSSGGNANNVSGSGFSGEIGALGRIKIRNQRDWHNAKYSNGGYPQANSATQPGESGGIGEQTLFGAYAFSLASENKNNVNNALKLKSLIDFDDVCLGGSGGNGGAGGAGGESSGAIGEETEVTLLGGLGGRGGNGKFGFHAKVEEKTIRVTPVETLNIRVGRGGTAGAASNQIVGGQKDTSNFGTNGHNGNLGTNGEPGKPGALFLQWIGI